MGSATRRPWSRNRPGVPTTRVCVLSLGYAANIRRHVAAAKFAPNRTRHRFFLDLGFDDRSVVVAGTTRDGTPTCCYSCGRRDRLQPHHGAGRGRHTSSVRGAAHKYLAAAGGDETAATDSGTSGSCRPDDTGKHRRQSAPRQPAPIADDVCVGTRHAFRQSMTWQGCCFWRSPLIGG